MASLNDRMAQGNGPVLRKISGVTSATIGTSTTHAHGLQTFSGGPTVPEIVIVVPTGNGVVYVAAPADATNITVRGSVASLPFDAYVG